METWRKHPQLNYEVSDLGNIRSLKTKAILKPFDRAKYGPPLQRGYLTVHLCDGHGKYQNRTVHSIVMLTYRGARPVGMVINHKNGDRADNRLVNLEYCTQSYNRKQDFILGRQSLRGEKNTQVKLTEAKVMEILNLYRSGGHTYASLAKKYGVHMCGISNIMNGHCWSYITGIKKRY